MNFIGALIERPQVNGKPSQSPATQASSPEAARSLLSAASATTPSTAPTSPNAVEQGAASRATEPTMKDQVGEDAGTPPAYFAMASTEPETAPVPAAEAEPRPSPAAPQPDVEPAPSATAPQGAPEPEPEPSATAPKQEPERMGATPVASGSGPDAVQAAAGSALGPDASAPERSGGARPELENRVETESPAPSAPIATEPAPPSGRESLFEAVRVLREDSESKGREMERLA